MNLDEISDDDNDGQINNDDDWKKIKVNVQEEFKNGGVQIINLFTKVSHHLLYH